jgi:hypothetical protein
MLRPRAAPRRAAVRANTSPPTRVAPRASAATNPRAQSPAAAAVMVLSFRTFEFDDSHSIISKSADLLCRGNERGAVLANNNATTSRGDGSAGAGEAASGFAKVPGVGGLGRSLPSEVGFIPGGAVAATLRSVHLHRCSVSRCVVEVMVVALLVHLVRVARACHGLARPMDGPVRLPLPLPPRHLGLPMPEGCVSVRQEVLVGVAITAAADLRVHGVSAGVTVMYFCALP